MDRSGHIHNLFSRGSSPGPQPPYFDQAVQPQQSTQYQHVSPSQLGREPAQFSSPGQVDPLLSDLSTSITEGNDSGGASTFAGPSQQKSSTTTTPVSSVTAQSASSTASKNAIPESRQSALLSILGSTVSVSSTMLPAPQQVPTPPGSSPQRSMVSSMNESQGRLLLEQLMSGSGQTNHLNPLPSHLPLSGPSPPYPPSEPQSRLETSSYYEPESIQSQEVNSDMVQSPSSVSQALPQKSMFDFISPFDALASGISSSSRKPVPPISQLSASSAGNDASWDSLASADPKRKSVDNLIEQLTRAQPQTLSTTAVPYDEPTTSEDTLSEILQARVVPRPLPPKPTQATSPSGSPPTLLIQQRRETRLSGSPMGPVSGLAMLHASPPVSSRAKESSPSPRGSWKGQENRGRGPSNKAKSQSSSNSQPQLIVFDVSQPLDDIQAPRDAVKSTAIALVRVDSTFLPGTTIGATHWVAYAMTKGRVRVISRSSGDRTLLQLPQVFSATTAVTDMAVFGNRLAGITSDGGFVVWELPEIITDDVPGKVSLCVLPASGPDALHSVKWHPQQEDTMAVASQSNIYTIHIADAARIFGGDPIEQSDLRRICQPFSISSPLVAFEFDVAHTAIATMSEDSTLTFWNIRDKHAFWTQKIRGDDTPSSITFVEGGLVLGRKNGTEFQLLQSMSKNVLAVIKFVNEDADDPEMFGHANYDSRIQTLWVANNRRDSMIAFKLGFETVLNPSGTEEVRPYFEQVVEFVGPKPTIHFVILTADADPTGEEAHAACVAAKVPIGDLALVAFSVHSTGVDQVLIRKEWFDGALISTGAKFPPALPPALQSVALELKIQRQVTQSSPSHKTLHPVTAPVSSRLRTPPSEEAETDLTREEGRSADTRSRGKGKNVGWKDKDENGGREKEKLGKGTDSGSSESPLGTAMTKEIKKMEENLYSRIGRLVGKELDKQHQRLEEVRASEQAADFARQEKILKLISNELTKNTTRVVEMAVKTEVQTSVLPALENITKNEVKAALSGQIAKGLGDTMNKALPSEIERLLIRPDVSNHIARTFSSAITPIIERHVKDAITNTLIPAYSQQSSAMYQDLCHEMHAEMLNIKKEVIAWQSEALRGQEDLIRDLEQSIRSLSDQVKYMNVNSANPPGPRRSPVPSSGGSVPMVPFDPQQHLRQGNMVPGLLPSNTYGSFLSQHVQHVPPSQSGTHGAWFPSSMPAPQASHPVLPPPAPIHQSSPMQSEEPWDDTYLAVLGTQDPRQLRELLARSNPEVVMPLTGSSPLSQAVILTLVHRLAAAIGESAPVDESFKSSLWWLQRASAVLNTNDPLIAPYIARVLPNVQAMLNTTKQRIAILPPGAPQAMETARSIADIQDILSHKPT